MKRNRIAAAALALALATPVVANAASTTTTSTPATTRTTEAGVGNFAITEEYRRKEAKYVEAWKEVRAAKEVLDSAKSNEATAKAAYEKALKALRDFEARYGSEPNVYTGSYKTDLDRIDGEIHSTIQRYLGAAHAGRTSWTDGIWTWTERDINANHATVAQFLADYAGLTHVSVDTISKYIVKDITTGGLLNKVDQEAQAEAIKDVIALNERKNELVKEIGSIENKRANLQAEVYRRLGDYNEAVNKRQTAENAYNAAESKYEAAKDKFIGAGASRSIIAQAERDGDVSIVTTVTTTTTPAPAPAPTVSTSTTVTTGTVAPSKGITAEQRKALEKAVADAEVQIQAVKFLKETTPKTIKGVVGKLDKLVAEQEVRLATARAALAKSTASNVFFSVAHADDENLDVDKLINDINSSTQEIKDTLKSNEEAQPEKVEDADKEKVEDEKEDNKEDKKEETKVIEKTTTVVTPAASNKTAGSNAKTGIAGIAGVAGVLAAATAAYAASKKN